jgi:beta-lactam-binding protein with PASTA domain
MFIRMKGGRRKSGAEPETGGAPGHPSLHNGTGFSRAHGKVFFFVCLGFLVFSVLLSVAVFFLSVRGAEQVLVPDVTGKDLVGALLDLQAKELYPQIQLRYSDRAAEKGTILEQNPPSGTIVKAGRRIRLVVSQGVRLSAVEDFVGKTLDDARLELEIVRTGSSDSGALVTLAEPILYRTSGIAAGTILEQDPAPGTAVTGPTPVTLVVSQGSDPGTKEMPSLIGLSPSEAAARLSAQEIPFVFTTKQAAANEKLFVVNVQDWPAETQIASDRTVTVQVTTPASWASEEICALYSYEVPRTPVPITYTLTALSPQGARTVLVSETLSGGLFTYPYLLQAGTTLSLGVQGRELRRELVEAR